MVAMSKPEAERAVVCPRCSRVQTFVVVRGGRLYVKGPRVVEITGYVCEECGKVKYWHVKQER